MMENEIAGALEKPFKSMIKVDQTRSSATITIPRSNLNWIMTFAIIVASMATIWVFTVGLFLFVFHHGFILYRDISPSEIHSMPPVMRTIYTFGWLIMSGVSFYVVYVLIKPLTSTQTIVITCEGIMIRETSVGYRGQKSYLIEDVRDFKERTDKARMREAILVMRLSPGASSAGVEEIEIGQSCQEIEKTWLNSVLNVLLKKFRLTAAC